MLILKIRNWGMKRFTHCPRPLSRKCRARIQTKEEAVLAKRLFCLSETLSPPPPALLTWGRPHPYHLSPNPHAHSDPSPVVILVSMGRAGPPVPWGFSLNTLGSVTPRSKQLSFRGKQSFWNICWFLVSLLRYRWGRQELDKEIK